MILYGIVALMIFAAFLDARGTYRVRAHARALAPWAATVIALSILAR